MSTKILYLVFRYCGLSDFEAAKRGLEAGKYFSWDEARRITTQRS